MSIVSENIKYLRKQMHFTQEQLADQIGIKRSLLGAYEEGRADPRLNNLLKMVEIFNITVDMILGQDLTKMALKDINNNVREKEFRVLAITTDKSGKENIELVPQKASAGYLNGYSDPEYLDELPKFNLPGLSPNSTYRAFELTGDSMLPLPEGTILVGKYVNQLTEVKNGKTYVILSKSEGVVYKRLYIDLASRSLHLASDNKIYKAYQVPFDDVIEIWEAIIYISREFPDAEKERLHGDISFDKLKNMVLDLQQEVMKLKSN